MKKALTVISYYFAHIFVLLMIFSMIGAMLAYPSDYVYPAWVFALFFIGFNSYLIYSSFNIAIKPITLKLHQIIIFIWMLVVTTFYIIANSEDRLSQIIMSSIVILMPYLVIFWLRFSLYKNKIKKEESANWKIYSYS